LPRLDAGRDSDVVEVDVRAQPDVPGADRSPARDRGRGGGLPGADPPLRREVVFRGDVFLAQAFRAFLAQVARHRALPVGRGGVPRAPPQIRRVLRAHHPYDDRSRAARVALRPELARGDRNPSQAVDGKITGGEQMHPSVIDFLKWAVLKSDIEDYDVLEVGAQDV